ncbi:Serine/threonine protein kinase [Nocardioides alpinus]|uniref:Serine/threonine protein kinase n=1 Tax=Nocardioides alpinus TaxID=748909 RepID=A0A1I1AGH3_9ACTN|nr:serine/threonine-protein kinase [Nocardioides alpinus]PKH41033.1 serine/threonine protein kinase [Nocardioides alpinus]SFB37091.1 Serine/threonine protein kinase [Nocardioides alpinus]
MGATTATTKDSWGFAEGDQITAELSALRLLGGGSAFEAWLAFDEITFSPVVVKVLRPSQVEDESSRRGLRREVLALAEINHPVVVRGLRGAADDVRPHVVLECIDGPRLSSLIRRHGRLQDYQYLPLAIDIAASLHYFSRIGWTHLDIKPSNVIMGSPARLIDLSVARPEPDARRLSYPIGTDAYMSPEQADPGARVPSYASDVWGLGATLFHAVAGQKPFADGDARADDIALRFPQLTSARAPLPDDVPTDVARVIDACLQPDPADRPLPADVSDALQPVLERLPRGSLGAFKIRG